VFKATEHQNDRLAVSALETQILIAGFERIERLIRRRRQFEPNTWARYGNELNLVVSFGESRSPGIIADPSQAIRQIGDCANRFGRGGRDEALLQAQATEAVPEDKNTVSGARNTPAPGAPS
jgi:hypothetical protein